MTIKGTVKFYNKDKKYGFIQSDEYNKDIFFHETEIKEENYTPEEDDEISFETKETKRGLQAINIKKNR